MIFLCTLTCDLGGNQFAMKCLIIIVLIHIQVHVGNLLAELARLHLLLELIVLLLVGHVTWLICCIRLTNLLFIVLLLKHLVSVFLYIIWMRNLRQIGI